MFDLLSQKFSSIFSYLSGNNKLSQKNIAESLTKIQEALLEADVPYDVVKAFSQELEQEVIGKKVIQSLKPSELFTKIVYDKIVHFLGGQQQAVSFTLPVTIMVVGLQGSGKTTSIAKIAAWAKKDYKNAKILLASVDYYRPAAIDQLEILAKQIQVDFYRSPEASVQQAVQDIYQHVRKHNYTMLLLDTAGRLHIDNQLLGELKSIDSLIRPTHKLLVLDAMTGQESLHVAKAFDQAIGIDGAMLSKMDSQARAGAAFAFVYSLKKPMLFMGIGEKVEDFELFRPDRVATRMMGMGDLKSLIENVEQKIKKQDQDSLEKAFSAGKFTLQDFAKQLEMIGKLGSLTSLMKFMPGMGGISSEMVQKGEVELKRFKAIINSMNPKERANHKILNRSRKERIAAGAGVAVQDIDIFLDRFEKSQEFVKLFKKHGRMPFM